MRVWSLPLAGCLLALVSPTLSAEPITGTVRGPDGLPVAQARVVVERPTGAVVLARTGPDGTFTADVPPGRYLLHVVADALVADVRQVDVTPSSGASFDVDMRLAAVAEAVVVSAAHVPLTRSTLGASLTVIDEDELRTRQVESTVDALRSVPGLAVSRSGGRGSVTSLFPRGGESDFTLVLVDGIRLNDLGGAFDAAHLPLFDLQQIEVVRGPQSATYGSDAIGGVVQLVTRRGGPPRAEGLVEAGSFGTTRANATAAGSLGRLRVGATITAAPTPPSASATTTSDGRRAGSCASEGTRAAFPDRSAAIQAAPTAASTASRAATTTRWPSARPSATPSPPRCRRAHRSRWPIATARSSAPSRPTRPPHRPTAS
jgi:hypothetical protein